MKSLRLPTLFASLSILGVAACSSTDVGNPPLSPADVRARITALVPPMVARSTDAVSAARTPLAALGKLAGLVQSADTGEARIVYWNGMGGMHFLDRHTALQAPVDGDPRPTPRPGIDLASYLAEDLFTDANFRDGEFEIPTTMWCGGDAGCATRLAEKHYRIIVTGNGTDGLDLEMVQGLERETVATITLDSRTFHASVDLAGLAPVMSEVLRGPDAGPLAVEASGVIDADLSVLGQDDATAGLTIEEPVHVAIHPAHVPAPDAAFSLDLAAAAPALAIHLDGPHHEVVSGFTFDRIRLQLPADAKTPTQSIDLPALRMSATARAGQAIEIQGLSIGERSADVSVGGRPGTLDLNADSGRSVDLSIEEEADTGAVIVEAAPALDLVVSVDVPSSPDRVRLVPANGANGALRVSADGVEVVGGLLTLEMKLGAPAVAISAGQCVGRSAGRSDLALGAVECSTRETR